MKAIGAVFELQKPKLWKNLGNETDGYKCEVCEGNSYPCPTIQAIEKELTPLSKSQVRRITKVKSDELRKRVRFEQT